MNERIAQLMAYASGGACYDGNQLALYGENIEKFAELIVRECAQIAKDVDGDSRAKKCVLEYFGVKE